MPVPDRHDRPLPSDVVDAGEKPDRASVREVYRATHPLSVSVMERPQQYRVAYSLGDIHRLTFLSHDERTAVRSEWHAWHRCFVRLGPRGVCIWMGGVGVAFVLWWFAGEMSSATERILGLAVPRFAFVAAALAAAAALILRLPAFLATLFAAPLADSYLRGYADGITHGVNRALRITPEMEQEMWNELGEAERLDGDWRRVEARLARAPEP